MRKLIVKITNDDQCAYIMDWNFKTWTLLKVDKSTSKRQCKEMNGTFIFETKNDFISKMYGQDKIYPEWNREQVFVNYETELVC